MQIIVCILTDDPYSDKVKKLYSCFEHDIFDIKVYDITPNQSIDNHLNLNSDALFKYRFNWCLKDVVNEHPDQYLMIVRDDVISSIHSTTLADAIEKSIHYNNDAIDDAWDILYLSAWGDDCNNYKKLIDIPEYNMYISKTKGPSGSSAFILAPPYCKRLVETQSNKELFKKSGSKKKNAVSMILLPLPFSIDPIENNDFVRNNLQYNDTNKDKSVAYGLPFVWYFVILFIAVLLVSAMIKFK